MYRLRLFGGVALAGPAGPVEGRAVQPRRLALLALLGASRNHGWSREKLIALLWPDTDPAEARRHLSQSVYLLRKGLGEDAIATHGESVELNTDVVWTDVGAFHEALREGEPERAIDLYAGPFLDGFYVRDAPDFEEWSEAERRSLADTYATSVETVARAAAGDGDHIKAADLWRRLVSHDPYNSRAVLALMGSLVESGDPGNALVVAEEHAECMRRDLGVGVPAEVDVLVGRIREGQPVRQPKPREPGPALASQPVPASSTAVGPARRRRWPLAFGALVVVAVGAAWGVRAFESPPVPQGVNSLAVLPFLNLTGDPGTEHLVDGITDELISTLSRVPELKVPAQTTSFHFKGRPLDARVMGDSLGVAVLLEGSVRGVDDGIRITAQLIDAESGFHLWTDTYDRPHSDWPRIPSELAASVVTMLGLGEDVESARFKPRTEVLSAWEDYEKGRRYWRLRLREGHDTAFAAFRRAIEADSSFALAWSGLADTHLTAMDYGDIPRNDSVRAETRALAIRAVVLDSTLAETRTSLAAALFIVDGDREAAEAQYLRAIEIDPGYVVAYYWYAELLNRSGRYDDALRVITRAYEVDPLSPVGIHHLGWNLMWNQARVADALRYFEYVLDLEPAFRNAQINQAVALAFLGRFDEAREAALRMLETNPNDMAVATNTVRILVLVRDYDRLEAIVDSMDASQSRYAHYYTAQVYAHQGRFEDALAEYRAAAVRYGDDDELKLLISYTYALAGDTARARAIADPIVAKADSLWVTQRDRQSRWLLREAAGVYGAIGDGDTAFELLERVFEINKGTLANLAVHPKLVSLHDDPRFDDMLARLGLPKIEGL